MTRKVTSLAFSLLLFAAGLAPTKTVMLAQEQAQGSERRIVRKVTPEYPEIARRFKIVGKVKVQIVIGADGRVKSMRVLGGHPVLVQSVEDAVKKWQYAPNGAASTQMVEIEFAGNEVR